MPSTESSAEQCLHCTTTSVLVFSQQREHLGVLPLLSPRLGCRPWLCIRLYRVSAALQEQPDQFDPALPAGCP